MYVLDTFIPVCMTVKLNDKELTEWQEAEKHRRVREKEKGRKHLSVGRSVRSGLSFLRGSCRHTAVLKLEHCGTEWDGKRARTRNNKDKKEETFRTFPFSFSSLEPAGLFITFCTSDWKKLDYCCDLSHHLFLSCWSIKKKIDWLWYNITFSLNFTFSNCFSIFFAIFLWSPPFTFELNYSSTTLLLALALTFDPRWRCRPVLSTVNMDWWSLLYPCTNWWQERLSKVGTHTHPRTHTQIIIIIIIMIYTACFCQEWVRGNMNSDPLLLSAQKHVHITHNYIITWASGDHF